MKQFNQSVKISRRKFLNRSISVWALITSIPFIYGIVSYLFPGKVRYMTYRLRNDPELLNTEFFINDISEYSSGIKLINDHEYLIVRRQGNDIKIYDGLCTHLDCIVKYRNDSNDIFCNCHGGRFDMNGNVLEGPPKKPLKIYNYEITGNKVVIKS